MIASALIWMFLALRTPDQMTDVISSVVLERGTAIWLIAMTPVVAAAFCHLVLQAKRTTLTRKDTALTCIPLIALAIMAGRWSPVGLWFILPVLVLVALLGFAIRSWIARHTHLLRWVVAGLVIVAIMIVVVGCALEPLEFPRRMGPLEILTLGLSVVGLLIAFAAFRPLVALIYVVLCLVAQASGVGSRPVPLTSYVQPQNRGSDGLATGDFAAWLRARPDLDDYRKANLPYPVIIASAEGGGMYAAAHAFFALSGMQAICPSFNDHLFATVGVSGGSIGTALYAARIPDTARRPHLVPCHAPKEKLDIRPVTTDLLSPPLANLLLLQPLDFLVPFLKLFPDSGEISSSAMEDLAPKMRLPLRAAWKPENSRPATMFVATDVQTGKRVVLSPLDPVMRTSSELLTQDMGHDDIATGTAAFISARFPWLTPTARLKLRDGTHLLADGGYLDNSGAEMALDLIAYLRQFGQEQAKCESGHPSNATDKCECPIEVQERFAQKADWAGCRIPIFIAYMPIVEDFQTDEALTGGPDLFPRQSYFWDPLTTMLSVRNARSALAYHQATRTFGGLGNEDLTEIDADKGFFRNTIRAGELALPLGWKLSTETANKISLWTFPLSPCPTEITEEIDGETEPQETQDGNQCHMKMMAYLFQSDPKAYGIFALSANSE
jgi:hypothetical protein